MISKHGLTQTSKGSIIKTDGHRFEITIIGNIGLAIYIFVAITKVLLNSALNMQLIWPFLYICFFSHQTYHIILPLTTSKIVPYRHLGLSPDTATHLSLMSLPRNLIVACLLDLL